VVLPNKSVLRIVIEDNADGIHGDNIDPGNAGFITQQ